MLCRKHPNNREKETKLAFAGQDQLLLRTAILSPKGPTFQHLDQASSNLRQPTEGAQFPKRKKAGEYINYDGFGSAHPNDRGGVADERTNLYTHSSAQAESTAHYLAVANEGGNRFGSQLGESGISLRKQAIFDDNSMIGRHRRAAHFEQPSNPASNPRKARPVSCGLSLLGRSQAEAEPVSTMQANWTVINDLPAPSLTLSSVYNSARKPADPVASLNFKSSHQNNLMADSMTSSAIKKNLSLRKSTRGDQKSELLEKIYNSRKEVDSLTNKIASLKRELRELVPDPSPATLSSLQARSTELQHEINFLSQATESVQAENQTNMSRLRTCYEEKMQSENARTGDLSDCAERLKENRFLKQRLSQKKVEFEGKLLQKIESMKEKSSQQLELEKEYLDFKYETDPEAIKFDLTAYYNFLRDRNQQLAAAKEPQSASLFSRLFS